MKDEIIEKSAPKSNLPVIKSIQERFSPRVFSPTEFSDEDIAIIFEAARLAPSARNHQPWEFKYVRRTSSAYQKFEECIPERNLWCRTASLFIVASYSLFEPKDGKNKWCKYDLGAACVSLILQAQELGYYSRQIGSFDAEKAKMNLNIQDPYIPFVVIAMGKIGNDEDYNNAPEDIIDKELMPWSRRDDIYEEVVE